MYLKYFHVEICPLGTAYVIKVFDCWHWNKQIQRKAESDTEDCSANRRLIKDLAQIYFVFFKCYVFQQTLTSHIWLFKCFYTNDTSRIKSFILNAINDLASFSCIARFSVEIMYFKIISFICKKKIYQARYNLKFMYLNLKSLYILILFPESDFTFSFFWSRNCYCCY